MTDMAQEYDAYLADKRKQHEIDEEHWHEMEECKYAEETGDKRWPILCLKDNRVAPPGWCENECDMRSEK